MLSMRCHKRSEDISRQRVAGECVPGIEGGKEFFMRCLYREKKVISGNYLEVDIFPVFKEPNRRIKKAKPTSEAQKLLNSHNAAKKLTRILNANFTAEDIKCELTYAPEHKPETEEDAKRDLSNFLRRVKRFRAKNGLPELKYITVTEKGEKSGRLHHHVAMSGGILPVDIARLWGKGYVQKIQPLQFNETGVAGIAWYMAGYKRGEIVEPLFYRRWNASKNLIKPTEPPTSDSRYSAKQAKRLADGELDRAALEKLYPDYVFVDCTPIQNKVNNGYYLYLRFYKKGVRFY